MKTQKRKCPHCGASMNEHLHALSKGIVAGLVALIGAGGEANLRTLHLTRNQWDNFQKLRYWDLVEQVAVDGVRQRGVWKVTKNGRAFARGAIAVQRRAWTYRGVTQRFEGESMSIGDVDARYKHRPEYQADAKAHELAPRAHRRRRSDPEALELGL